MVKDKEIPIPQNERNYETRVDSFMPYVTQTVVDKRLYPRKDMDKFELLQEYKQAYGDKRF